MSVMEREKENQEVKLVEGTPQNKSLESQTKLKKLANGVCALSAEKSKFASEVEALRGDKANSSSNN